MIGIIFEFGNELIEVRIVGTDILFRKSDYGSEFFPIEAMQLSKEGVIREFPDLRGDLEWKSKAVQRFKSFIKALPTEIQRAEYIANDLKKYGYVPRYRQREGHRIEKLQ